MNNEHDDKRPLSERDKDDGHKQSRKEYKPVIAAYLRARSARCLSIPSSPRVGVTGSDLDPVA